MKFRFQLVWAALFGAAFAAATAAEPPFLGDARPPRRIAINRHDVITVTAADRGTLEIVIPPKSCGVVRFAASELREYLGRLLGGDIAVTEHPTEGRVSLILGVPAAEQAGVLDPKTLCRDGFILKRAGRKIYLAGRDDPSLDMDDALRRGGVWIRLKEQATLFAVYDFLERFAGIRFYFPGEDGTVIPASRVLTLPAFDLFDRPDMEARHFSVFNGVGPEDKPNAKPYSDSISRFKNRACALYRMQTKYVPNSHGLALLDYGKRFGASHPEFFALRSDGRRYCGPEMAHTGQFCYSSDALWREIELDAEALLRGEPPSARGISGSRWNPTGHQPGAFGAMPQDGFFECRCPACLPHWRDRASTGEFIWGRVIDLAEQLRARRIDGIVTMMSYHPYDRIPARAIPDNVWVMVAGRGPWAAGSPAGKRELEQLQAWNRKLGRKVWTWNYAGKFGSLNMPGIPCTTPRAIGRYYRATAPWSYGAFLESETDLWLGRYLDYYVLSKVLWDTSVDVDALLEEHHRKMFGSAAPVMKELFDRWESLWIARIGARTVETPLGPAAIPPSEAELWRDIYSESECAAQRALWDRAERLTAREPDAHRRVGVLRRVFFDPMEAARADYRRRSDAVRAFRAAGGDTLYLQRFGAAKKGESPVGTTVRIERKADRLRFTIDCEEPQMAQCVAVKRPANDPELWQDNNVELFLRLPENPREYLHIGINSAGSGFCFLRKSLGGSSEATSSAEMPAVKVTPRPDGWTAEAELRFPLGTPPVLHANFGRSRVVGDRAEYYTWTPFLKRGFHEPEHFGAIDFGAAPKGGNLLRNADFTAPRSGRNGFGAWRTPYRAPEGCAAEPDHSTFVSGGVSLKLTGGGGPWFVRQSVDGVKGGKRYRFGYFIRLENVRPLGPEGGAGGNLFRGRNLWFPANRLTGTTPWLRQEFEFTMPETPKPDTPAAVLFQLIRCTGTVWIDGVTLEELP